MGPPPHHPWWKTGSPESFLGCQNYFDLSLKEICFLVIITKCAPANNLPFHSQWLCTKSSHGVEPWYKLSVSNRHGLYILNVLEPGRPSDVFWGPVFFRPSDGSHLETVRPLINPKHWNILNCFRDYKRCIDISFCILDFVLQRKTKFTIMTMEQHYMSPYILYCLYHDNGATLYVAIYPILSIPWQWSYTICRHISYTVYTMTMELHYMSPYILYCLYHDNGATLYVAIYPILSIPWQWSNTICRHISYTVYTMTMEQHYMSPYILYCLYHDNWATLYVAIYPVLSIPWQWSNTICRHISYTVYTMTMEQHYMSPYILYCLYHDNGATLYVAIYPILSIPWQWGNTICRHISCTVYTMTMEQHYMSPYILYCLYHDNGATLYVAIYPVLSIPWQWSNTICHHISCTVYTMTMEQHYMSPYILYCLYHGNGATLYVAIYPVLSTPWQLSNTICRHISCTVYTMTMEQHYMSPYILYCLYHDNGATLYVAIYPILSIPWQWSNTICRHISCTVYTMTMEQHYMSPYTMIYPVLSILWQWSNTICRHIFLESFMGHCIWYSENMGNKKLQQTTKNTFGPGARFTKDISHGIQIRWKFNFART